MEIPSLHSITDIKLTLHSNINIPKEITTSGRRCLICSSGKMIFTDTSLKNKRVILNNDGTLNKEITCSPYYPRDVTFLIDVSTVAVSTSVDIQK